MTSKWGVGSGILVAILAQCVVLVACDGEGSPPEGDGGAGGESAGDGDGDECDSASPITVDVLGGWQEAEGECRTSVALTFTGKTYELSCSAAGSDCTCSLPSGVTPPRENVALTVVDGETVLFAQSDLEDGGECDSPRFGVIEVDYIEALGQAVARLKNAAPEMASPEPCDTESDCEAVPLGSKACGGPWSYAVVSTESETYSNVVALAEELERIEQIYNVVAEVTSDCAYEMEPELACDEGVCVAAPE